MSYVSVQAVDVVCPESMDRLKSVTITVENEPGWFLKRLVVHDTRTGESVSLPCDCWLSSDSDAGDGFSSSITLNNTNGNYFKL